MQSKAATVAEYVKSLPEDRRQAVEAVRKVIRENLDSQISEVMQYGMIGYCVPHALFPQGYHCDPAQPLPVGGLASQKGYLSFYWMPLYGSSPEEKWFRERWAKTGKKLDMGKCCVRFKKLEDLPLDVIGETVRRMTAKAFIAQYLKHMPSAKTKPAASKKKRSK